MDGSTGLQYLRARYYDMEMGRFMSRDPLAKFVLWNGHPYVYASNLPTILTDPQGLYEIEDVFPVAWEGEACDCSDEEPRGKEPMPVPLPSIGSHDTTNCDNGRDTCLDPNSWFRRGVRQNWPRVST